MGTSRRRLLVVIGMLVLAACQGAVTATPSAAPPTPSPATPTATTAPTPSPTPTAVPTTAATFPSTALVATLDIAQDSSGAPFDPAKVGGITAGQVQASWYRTESLYVVVYAPVDLGATGALCPGNSIQTATTFEFISNAPTAPGACKGELPLPPVGVLLCASLAPDSFAYLTAIPVATQGVLYASIEKPQANGSIVGVTGRAPTSAGQAPKVDLDALGCSPVPGV